MSDYDYLLPDIDYDNKGQLVVKEKTGQTLIPDAVPMGIKDSRDRRKLIYSGNKAKLNNIIMTKILESQGVTLPDDSEPSILEKIFKGLDYPASKVRQFITGKTSEEGNTFGPVIKEMAGVKPYEEAYVPPAAIYRTGKHNPMAIDPQEVEVIPGTNVKRHSYDLLRKLGYEISQPNFIANAGASSAGVALDILTDPLTVLGPGVLKAGKPGEARKLLSVTSPAFTGMPAKTFGITPKIMDEAYASAMNKIFTGIGKTKVGKAVGKALIPGYGLPKDYYLFHRDTVDKINYEVNKLYRQADEAFKDLSEDELKIVSHYVEGTRNIDNIPEELLPKIETAAAKYREMQAEFTTYLKENGILKAGLEADETYVPHIYPGRTQEAGFRTGEKLEIKPREPFFTKRRKHETLSDSIEAGNEPMERIDDIFKEYGNQGITEIGKRKFIDQTLEQFGTRVHSIAEAKNLIKDNPELGMYAPKGAFRFHPEKYVPKKLLAGEELIEISKNDLKDGLMMTKNVPVYTLPREVARDMNRLEKVFGDEEATRKFLGFFDKLTAWWKGRVTVTSPGFHIRNAYSNMINAYLGGLEDVGRYKKALDVVLDKPGRFAGMDNNVIKDLAERYGVYTPTAGHWMREIFGPEVIKKATTKQLVNPLATRFAPVEIGRKVGSAIENNARMALFIDRLAKGDRPLQASIYVKKYLFDYSELTPMERNFFRRVVPFYTWMRKNIPLQIEGLITNPKVAAQVGKLTDNRYGEENNPTMEDRNWQFKDPLTTKITGGENPIIAKLDFPMGDLDMHIKNLGIHPVLQLGTEVYKIATGKDAPNVPAPEFIKIIYDLLPEEAKAMADLPKVQSPFTDDTVLGMDPRLRKGITAMLPLFSKISRLIPTDENLADPNYETKISSYLTGVPIQVMDIRRNKAMRELITKSIIKDALNKGYKEGTINPAAIGFLRSQIKLQ